MKYWGLRLVFSLNSFAAAMLALFLALAMGLVNPFWSAMTVYIVSQPHAGSVRSKAFYRLVGTFVGAAIAVMVVPVLANAPELLSVTLACWVGLCLGVSLLDRTPRSYVFMLSGYTAALIGFPGVGNPGGVFETAVARVEEIGLGIVCATLLHSIILPQGVSGTLNARIDGFMRDAQRWMLDVLGGAHDPRSSDAHRLAADISELHIMATHLPFDTSHFQDRSREVHKLAERMAFLLPLAAATGDRIAALGACGAGIPAATAAVMRDVEEWVELAEAASLDAAEDLAGRVRGLEPAIGPEPDFATLALVSLHVRLAELIETYRDCLALARHIRTAAPVPPPVEPLLQSAHAHALHRDYGMAAWSGAAAMAAILAVCAFWIASGWPDGGTAAMLTAIFMCFFAAMDDPAKAIDSFALYWSLSIPLAALYIFAIMPMLHGFAMLVLALAPALLALGVLIAIPRYTARALPVAMGLAGSLGIQETFAPDFGQFANASLAGVIGVLAASLVTRLVRSVGSDFAAARIFRLARTDLTRIVGARRPVAPAVWTSRMVDRVGLLGARVREQNDPADLVVQTLASMRVGLNLLALREMQTQGEGSRAAGRLLAAVGRRLDGKPVSDTALVTEIDAAIAEAAGLPAAIQREAMLCLIGLRRALFPASFRMEAA